MLNWLDKEHLYIAEWASVFITLAAVLVALFGQRLLAWWDRPRLSLEFDSGREPFIRETKTGHGLTSWLSVVVRNNGRSVATGCIGTLAAVNTDGAPRTDIDPVQLRWAGVPRSRGFEPLDLPPGGRAILNVLAALPFRGQGEAEIATFDDPTFDPGFPTHLKLEDLHIVDVVVTSALGISAELVIPLPRAGAWLPRGGSDQ